MAGRQGVNGNSSGGSDAAGSGSGAGDEVQRWTAGRKAAIVLDIIKGRTTPADAARLHGLTVADVESWVEKFLEGGKEGLRAVPRELEAKHGTTTGAVHADRGRGLRTPGLVAAPRPGAPRTVSDEDVERVIAVTLECAPPNATRWSTRSVARGRG